MASTAVVLNVIGQALWDANPHPTHTTSEKDRQARQLAFALGYPETWRVVRTVERVRVTLVPRENENNKDEKKETNQLHSTTIPQATQAEAFAAEEAVSEGQKQEDASPVTSEKENPSDENADVPENVEDNEIHNNNNEKKEDDTTVEMKGVDDGQSKPAIPTSSTTEIISDKQAAIKAEDEVQKQEQLPQQPILATSETNSVVVKKEMIESKAEQQNQKQHVQMVRCIVDRIYAGKPGSGCDMWFHHEAAMQAAKQWHDNQRAVAAAAAAGGNAAAKDASNDDDDQEDTATPPGVVKNHPYMFGGGHLLERLPAFDKGDKVQVYYEDKYWDAKVTRRRKVLPEGHFLYQVQYTDNTKQSNVPEERIRLRPSEKDPGLQATELGLGPGWKAVLTGHNRYKITSPEGKEYAGKKAALADYKRSLAAATGSGGTTAAASTKPPQEDDGDPPWRLTDNPYLGRFIQWTTVVQKSASRQIKLEQLGRVAGWISETDVDQQGQPGFVSEKTGLPARLYRVVFDDDPDKHPYGAHLVTVQDLEEYELIDNLVPDEDVPASKKKKITASKSAASATRDGDSLGEQQQQNEASASKKRPAAESTPTTSSASKKKKARRK